MPGFVKTPADEKKWSRAKDAASQSTKVGSEGYWKLANYIFHKGELDKDLAKALGSKLSKVPSTAIPSPTKVGSTAVKMPKTAKQPDPFGKPSLFFKTEMEEFSHVKHPTLCKLRDFILRKHKI